MSSLYPVIHDHQGVSTKEQLMQLALEVPSLPESFASLTVPQLAEFFTGRYGKDMSTHLSTAEIAGLDEISKLNVMRALDIHGQTHFFRDPFSIRALKQLLLPTLHERTPIRIASVGCSTGEELISILLSNWERRTNLELTGFDINPQHIQDARSRRWYLSNISPQQDPAATLSSHFENNATIIETTWNEAFQFIRSSKPGRVEVTPSSELSTRMSFQLHDILLEPLRTKYDIIILQNVLCHYTPLGREEIVKKVWASLNPGGYFVGDAAHTLRNAALDPLEFGAWYAGLETNGYSRVQLPTWAEWCKKTIDETSCLFVYRK